jgi:hypothetical protein
MAHEATHTVTIRQDHNSIKEAEANGETILPTDPEYWILDVRCHADSRDYTRNCVTWYECSCALTTDQWHQLVDDGTGPCPESPTSEHRAGYGVPRAQRPSDHCWVEVCDNTQDAIWELADKHKLGPGEYPVLFWTDGDEGEYIDFDLATAVTQ